MHWLGALNNIFCY